MKTAQFADNNFTLLRLVLALMVVLGHFRLLAGVASPHWPFSYAAAAVDCFFVVSGYLITQSFDQHGDLRDFYVKRVCRLYPLYIVVVTAQTAMLAVLTKNGLPALGRYFLANAVFANFLTHDIDALAGLHVVGLNPSLWTLKIEFGFYLLLPALWWLVRRHGDRVLLAIFAASALFFAAFNAAGHYEIAKQLPGQLQFFVLGMALYKYRGRFSAHPGAGLLLAALCGLFLTLLLRLHPQLVYPVAVAAFVAAAALMTPPLRPARDISYGVYLLHGPVIQFAVLKGFYRPDIWGLAAVFAIVLALAALAERLVEAPGIALGRRLLRRRAISGGGAADQPVSVLVLNDFCHVQGGASKVAIDEAVNLARAGVPVTFLGAVGPVCEALREPGLAVECLDQPELLDVKRHPRVIWQALWNHRAYWRTRAILSAMPRGRTVAHLHGYSKAMTTSPVRAARKLGVPVICTLHDFYAACPNGAFFDYNRLQPCPRAALSAGCITTSCDKRHYVHKLYRVARGFSQRLLSRFPAQVSNYIALSNRSLQLMGRYLPAHARIFPLANMMNLVRQPQVTAAANRTIVHVGRLEAEKGVLLLARTAAQLGLKVTFVGDGPQRSQIEAIAGMTVTGWLDHAGVSRHLSAARCLVFPSLWYETFGLVVDEALARGIPVIVSDISAAAERVQDTMTGWLFRSGDGADLARCLILLQDDDRVRAAGDAAYCRYWRDPATPDVHVQGLLRIYRHVMLN